MICNNIGSACNKIYIPY